MSDALLEQMQRDAERLANPPRPAPAPVIVVEDRPPTVWRHEVERDAATGLIVVVTSRPEIPAESGSTIARAIHSSPYSRRAL